MELKEFEERTKTITTDDEYWKDNKLWCKKCNTPKSFVSPDETFCVKCQCECEREELKKLEEKEQYTKFLENLERNRKIMLPYSEIRQARFENNKYPDDENIIKCEKYANKFTEALRENMGIFMYGEMGSGKTYCEGAIANALIDKGYKIYFINTAHLITIFDSGKRTEISTLLNEIETVDLLILDDLGVERGSEFALSKLYECINIRSLSGKPLVISSNLSMSQIKELSNSQLQRIYDRIFEHCRPLLFKGNKRLANARENFNKFNDLIWKD